MDELALPGYAVSDTSEPGSGVLYLSPEEIAEYLPVPGHWIEIASSFLGIRHPWLEQFSLDFRQNKHWVQEVAHDTDRRSLDTIWLVPVEHSPWVPYVTAEEHNRIAMRTGKLHLHTDDTARNFSSGYHFAFRGWDSYRINGFIPKGYPFHIASRIVSAHYDDKRGIGEMVIRFGESRRPVVVGDAHFEAIREDLAQRLMRVHRNHYASKTS